jgi:hypothetical protein
MNFIKKLTEEKQQEFTLSKYLQEHLEGYSKARSVEHIHASDLTKDDPAFCPREIALLRMTGKKRKDQYLNQSLKVAFTIGEAYHDMIRNVWLRDIAIGNWKCPHCDAKIEFSKKPKIKCPECGSKKWEYDEVRFNSTELDVSGAIDLMVDLQLQKTVIVEIKSMDKDQFGELIAPLAEHRIRTSLYLKIIESSDVLHKDKIDLTHARIIYVSKGYGKKGTDGKFTPFKEYVIPRNDGSIQPYLDKAIMMKKFTDEGVVPCGVCKSSFDPRMKSCTVAPECFGQLYPAGGIFKKSVM